MKRAWVDANVVLRFLLRDSEDLYDKAAAIVGLVEKGKARTGTKVNRIVEALRSYQPERIYLFGSWARGEADELSDVDTVLIKRTESPFFDRLREVAGFLHPETGGLDVLVYTPEEFATMQREGNAFAAMIIDEGRLIYEREAES